MSRRAMRNGVWGVVAIALAVLAAPRQLMAVEAAAQQTPAAGRAVRVLFIGNSYTYYNGGLGSIIQSLATKAGQKMTFVEVTKGGESLEGHWKTGKALAEIKKGGWDYVVLQEQSTRPLVDPKKMAESIKLFDAEIKKVGAKTILYETWARKNKPETQTGLCQAYEAVARDINAMVAPAGRAWEAVLKASPKMALHVGDQSHPTPAGSYLNACVLYSTIFSCPCENMPRAIRSAAGKALFELPEADATLLQKSAAEILTMWRKADASAPTAPAATDTAGAAAGKRS